ncbi:MAG: hypothetical protein IJI14_00200 [Anaerolineaceae bacterium]|nr:hypothetical protein [Anaerolineaceae bacterium]
MNEKAKKTLIIILLAVLFLVCMVFINRDLFHFEYNFSFSRIFMPEENTKGNYLLTEQIPLKAGTYQFSVSGTASSAGNGCYIVNSADETIFEAEIKKGAFHDMYSIEIPVTTSVRAGFRYDPESGIFEANRISFSADHVLYKESLLRHSVLSLLTFLVFAYAALRLLKDDLPETVRRKLGFDLRYLEKVFLFLLCLTVLSSWPLFDMNRFTEGDDFYFHLSRIEGIALSLKAGYFPPRILLGWMGNYGVASEFYYPGLLMLIPVSLFLCGFSSITSLKIFLFLCTFFSVLTMFLAGKRIGKNKTLCGAGAALIYAFASYRLICLFYRNAVGEVQAFIFYPLIVWGLFEILNGNTKKWGIFALGFFGMLMSHMISLAISGILCAVYLLLSVKKLTGNKEIVFSLFKAAAVTIMLGAFFLLPMLEQLMKNELRINTNVSGSVEDWDELWFYVLTRFKNLFLPYDIWVANDERWISPHPGWIILCVPLFRLVLVMMKTRSDLRTADKMAAVGVVLLIAATDLFPWQFCRWFLTRIQFSWRMLGPASVLLSLAGGIYLQTLIAFCSRKRLWCTVFFLAAMLSGLPILIITFRDKMYPLSRLDLSNKVIHGAEYMPPEFDPAFIDYNKDKINTDETRTRLTESRRRKLGFLFSFEHLSDEEPVSYSVPLVYIYGYTAELTDPHGNIRPIPVSKDKMGLILVSDEGETRGTIRIAYEKTTVQKFSELISLGTLVFLAVRLLRKRHQILSR